MIDKAIPSSAELYDFAVKRGIINESELKSSYTEMKQTRYLERHFGSDWEQKIIRGKDGRYFTRMPDGRQLRKTDRADFITSIIEYYRQYENKQFVDGTGITAIFREWIQFRSDYYTTSKATLDRYEADYERFFLNNPLAEDLLEQRISDITEDELERFIRGTIKTMQLNPKSWVKFKAIVKNIWTYAVKKKAATIYIARFFDSLDINTKSLFHVFKNDDAQVFTDEEVLKIIGYIDEHPYSPHNYGILLAFFTGMRIGEIAGLMWEDVADDFRSLQVNHMETLCKNAEGVKNHYSVVDHAKTDAGIRCVIIPDAFIPYFRELKDHADSEYVFTDSGRRLHARSFTDKLYRICASLDIPKRSMHKARKTVCSKLCDSGVDDRLLLKQIGHTDRRTTENFYHRDRRSDEEKRNILNKAISY